jgi:hypothetical protein
VGEQNCAELRPCIYDMKLSEKIVVEVVRSLLEERMKLAPEYVITGAHARLWLYVAAYGAQMKHGGFRVENEWRLVHVHEVSAAGAGHPPMFLPAIDYRESRFGITPFVRFDLPAPSDHRMQALAFRLGPTTDHQPKIEALKAFLIANKYSINKMRFEHADIPYR